MKYEQQKRFDDCRYKRALPFDFYLPDYGICIEFDGEQHYREVQFFGGKEHFEYRKKCDQIKANYCRKSDIRLLRIKYNEDVGETLKRTIG